MKVYLAILLFGCATVDARSQPVPSPRQLKWQENEFYLFAHFGPNTFTDLEWGKGSETEEIFNPTKLDCGQWCRTAKAAGASGIILTAKHHDGFCLWPSKYSNHTIAKSKWKGGKGDVLRELSDSCRKYGLKFGVYLSPWDRNHPLYGTRAYNDIYVNMMKEIVRNYGPLFEFWWDGANGEGPNGKKQVYDWHRFEQTLRTVAPSTVVFSDIGPDIRWVGNENGAAGDPDWCSLDTAGFTRGNGAPPTDTLNHGNENGKNWIPAECDVSIRPGWFYHQNEDEKVKSPNVLFQIYLKSVGRGASLLLNVPPDRRGQFNEHDIQSLIGFRKLREESFDHPVAHANFGAAYSGPYAVKFPKASTVNCVMLREAVQAGQKIESFMINLKLNGRVVKKIDGLSVGRKRILTFNEAQADSAEISITRSKADPSIRELAIYHINNQLVGL